MNDDLETIKDLETNYGSHNKDSFFPTLEQSINSNLNNDRLVK